MYSYSWVKLKTGVKENNLPADPKQRRVVGLGKKKKNVALMRYLPFSSTEHKTEPVLLYCFMLLPESLFQVRVWKMNKTNGLDKLSVSYHCNLYLLPLS